MLTSADSDEALRYCLRYPMDDAVAGLWRLLTDWPASLPLWAQAFLAFTMIGALGFWAVLRLTRSARTSGSAAAGDQAPPQTRTARTEAGPAQEFVEEPGAPIVELTIKHSGQVGVDHRNPGSLDPKTDYEDDRLVRVFISSTFKDMQEERRALINEAIPALQARFRSRGVEILAVDLRWGVTEDDATLDVCLSEVSRCKPYFIGLLGERYGTVLQPDSLTDGLLERFPMLAGAAGRSLTEIEFDHGVLAATEPARHALFFERDLDWVRGLPEPERGGYVEATPGARAKLADFKMRVAATGTPLFRYQSPAGLGTLFEHTFGAILEEQFPAQDSPDTFERTRRLHGAYAKERSHVCIGFDPYLQLLNRHTAADDPKPILITGAAGGGKSTLLANWAQSWRKAHPADQVFEHYLAASPDSVDPTAIVGRLWEALNRATGENITQPAGPLEPNERASALDERLQRARAHSTFKDGSRIVVVLDGLDRLTSGRDLVWLPDTPGVVWIASALPSDVRDNVLSRGWGEMKLEPLSAADAQRVIEYTLQAGGRKLSAQRIARILGHKEAGLPLFLKTVIEELSYSATNDILDAMLGDYLSAGDISDLFDRVLLRLERVAGQTVTKNALSLIYASRTGLEEAAILALTNAAPLYWFKLRNGMPGGLREQQGRIALSHDFLRQAVERRYLPDAADRIDCHLALARYFDQGEFTDRHAEELPYQLAQAKANDQLKALLTDLDRFATLRARGDAELLRNWAPLRWGGDSPEMLLCEAFRRRVVEPAHWTHSVLALAREILSFLQFCGTARGPALQLSENVIAESETLLGPNHRLTLAMLGEAAEFRRACGDLAGAHALQEVALPRMVKSLGQLHPDTLTLTNNLATALVDLGQVDTARELLERTRKEAGRLAGAGLEDLFGAQDNLLLAILNNLATTHMHLGSWEAALDIHQQVLEKRLKFVGPDHPETLTTQGNLAWCQFMLGDLAGATESQERLTDRSTRVRSEHHPQTLLALNNLAEMYRAKGDHFKAMHVGEDVWSARSHTLGPDHPDTLVSLRNLIGTALTMGELKIAHDLQLKLVAAGQRAHPKAPQTLDDMEELAEMMAQLGQLEWAKKILERVIARRVETVGSDESALTASVSLYAKIAFATRDFEDLQKKMEALLDISVRLHGHSHPKTLANMANLAGVMAARLDFKPALTLLEKVLAEKTQQLGAAHPETEDIAADLDRLKEISARRTP